MAVPKRKTSRSNTRSRRANWKAKMPQINKRIVNGQVEYSVPHRVDEDGRYDGRQILDV